jgi:hypothetical protein
MTFTYTVPGFPDNPSGFSAPTPVSFSVGATDAAVNLSALSSDSGSAVGAPAGIASGGATSSIDSAGPGDVDAATGTPLLPQTGVPVQGPVTPVAGRLPATALSYRTGVGSVSLSYLAVVLGGAVFLAAPVVARIRRGRA